MTRQGSRLNDSMVGQESMEAQGMAAVGELPARDREFEALLQCAAAFQNVDSGCKLRGEVN
jgi:hypothetical protein